MTTEIEQFVVGIISEHVDRGLTLAEACDLAIAEVKRLGRGEELLAAVGAEALSSLWRQSEHQRRTSAGREPVTGGARAGGSRKVQPSRLGPIEDVFEMRYHVGGGRWKRVADLTWQDCAFIADERRQQGQSMLRWSEVFDEISKSVKREKAVSVRAAFGGRPAVLLAILKKAKESE